MRATQPSYVREHNQAVGVQPLTSSSAPTDGRCTFINNLFQGFGDGQRVGRAIQLIAIDVWWGLEVISTSTQVFCHNDMRIIFVHDRISLLEIREFQLAFDYPFGDITVAQKKTSVQEPSFSVLADELHGFSSNAATRTRTHGHKRIEFPEPVTIFFNSSDEPSLQFGAYFLIERLTATNDVPSLSVNYKLIYTDQ